MLYGDWINLKAKFKYTIHDLIDYNASDVESCIICPGVWPVDLVECKEHGPILFFNLLRRKKNINVNLSIYTNLKKYSDMLLKNGNITFLKLFKSNGKEVLSKRYVLHETKERIKIIKLFSDKGVRPKKRFFIDLCIRFINEVKGWNRLNANLDACLFNPVTGIEYMLPLVAE